MAEETGDNRGGGNDGPDQWQKMGVGSSFGLNALSSSWSSTVPSLEALVQNKRLILFLVVFGIFFLMITGSLFSPKHLEKDTTNLGFDSRGLRDKLRAVSRSALTQGAVEPLSTSYELLKGGGMQFIWSKAEGQALANKKASTTLTSKENPDGNTGFDPFDEAHLDQRMFVSQIPPEHTLILNKFNTIQDHALLVTRAWAPQAAPLGPGDLRALAAAAAALPALGFYNSGPAAGASQAHKHMQLIPLDVLKEYRPDAAHSVPVDELIAQESSPTGIPFTISNFDFKHAVVRIDGKRTAPEVLFTLYTELLIHSGLLDDAYKEEFERGYSSPSSAKLLQHDYNLLMTPEWMMVIPRTQREFEGVDVNALGFAGLLLTRGEAPAQAVRQWGPLHILNGVAPY